MALAKVFTRLLGAVAGSAMLMSATAPCSAFTLASSSSQPSAANPGIERVWWDQWGRWHSNHRHWGWRRQGWRPPPPGYGFYAAPEPPAFGVYVSPPPPPVYEYYGPRQRWGDEDD